MISIITCARKAHPGSMQERNVAKTVAAAHEYIAIDNSDNSTSHAAAYNRAIQRAAGDIFVFVHDDVFFMKQGWGPVLESKFSGDNALGIVGVAGTQYLSADNASWTAAGRPFIKGRLIHDLENGDFFAVVFSPENGDSDVVVCDGVFLAIRRELFEEVWFDETTFDGDCFYDLDYCMQVSPSNRIIVTTNIVVKKRSTFTYDKKWYESGKRFLEKYREDLPASCVDAIPGPGPHTGSQRVHLKGKLPQETIV